VIEHVPAMIFVKDATALRFERFNRAGEELLGRSRHDFLGKTDHDFFPAEQADAFVAKDREVLAERRRHDVAEEPIETPAGTRWLHTRKVPILDEGGEATHLLGISLDITAQRAARQRLEQRVDEGAALLAHEVGVRLEAERALRSKEEQLRQAVKMEAVGRLAGGIAHDFNNLLSVVLSYCDLTLAELGPSHPVRANIEEIRGAGASAATLTHQLLAFSRRQVLEPRILDINQVVGGMHGILRPAGTAQPGDQRA
jgi:PAS domain S-box-containing protein